jgi:hypothetical protein
VSLPFQVIEAINKAAPAARRSAAADSLRHLPGQVGGSCTRKDCALPLQSDRRPYDKPGTWGITVKVIDTFGNDTSQMVVVQVQSP